MDVNKEREAFLHEFEKTEQYRQQYGFYKIPLKYDEQKETWNFYDVQAAWEMWQAAKAQTDQKIKLLLCDEHLKKCESPTGVFNSQYPDEEPCLICLAKEAKAQAVPEGFILVKTADIAKLAITISRIDLMTYSESRSDNEKLAWQNVAEKIEAMIEAQEST
ncbi:hypothetical protein ACLIL3_002975 [Acinetobacter radioresistens]|uniref:hypothetical protein n=1 Tax=Acinetobacter radioresistens TaxID=40216 RepID=UPI0039850FC1